MLNHFPSMRRSYTPKTPENYHHHHHHHEVELIDNTSSMQSSPQRSIRSDKLGLDLSNKLGKKSTSILNRHPLHLRKELAKQKYAKYRHHEPGDGQNSSPKDLVQSENGEHVKEKENKDIAVDILYENQRGAFICGKALFSAKALGNLDPAPWTNDAQKSSATNITNHQPPDPSWEWVENKWTIYPSEVSNQGWEYSFAFHGHFSWHKRRWWNSFVRRRAWVRQRVKKRAGYDDSNLHMFNSDYFTVYPAKFYQKNLSLLQKGKIHHRSYVLAGGEEFEDEPSKDILDFRTLRKVMSAARIDREITEAIENFIQNGKKDLFCLKDQMHEIMHLYIFRASRRILITVIHKQLRWAFEQMQKSADFENKDIRDRIEILNATLRAAEEESKSHEYWSELKNMVKTEFSDIVT